MGMSSAAGLFQSVIGFVLVLAANAVVRRIDKDSAIFQGGGIMIKRDRVFQTVANLLLFLIALFCFLPILLLFSSSFSNETEIVHKGYALLPRQLDFSTYRYILNGVNGILRSYGISFVITMVGTILNLVITVLYAYPISRRDLKGRSFFFISSVFHDFVQRRVYSDLHDVDEYVSYQKYVSGVSPAESSDQRILCDHGKKLFLS